MPFVCSKRRALVGALAALVLFTACKGDERPSSSGSPASTALNARGVVRIGVWQASDPSANTYGGLAIRTLILPQLFRATPDGKWEAAIVEPGSDRTTPGAKSARFRLRRQAVWSDGTRINVRDLRRTMDKRFVASVAAPDERGDILVRFTQRLPGWRRLWSGFDTIAPPRAGLFGGPYTHDHTTPNLETVLVANPRYFEPARIRELRFVLVPQAEVSARLMERGELDVIAPPAFTDRTARLEQIKDARVLRGNAAGGGLTVALVTNPSRLGLEQRRALLSLTDRKRFVDVVLHGEASYDGPTFAPASPTPTSAVPSLNAPVELPPVVQYVRAMQRRGGKTKLTFDLRQAEFDQVFGAYASSDFDVLVRVQPSLPERCWVCEAGNVNPQLAADADAHVAHAAERLEKLLASEAVVLPLWREVPVVAVRKGIDGVKPNGFSAAGVAWNVNEWTVDN